MVWKKPEIKVPLDFKEKIRWIKKANMWLRLYVNDNKLIQEWTAEKPEIEEASKKN